MSSVKRILGITMGNTAKDSRLALSVANHVPAMLAYWDKEQICRFANKAYVAWFGKTREEMIDKITLEELLGSLYKMNLPFIQNVLAGKPQYFERDIPVPTGEVRSSIATYTPDIVNGKVIGFFVHVADITPIKTLETELKKSERKFKGLLESAPDAIVITNQAGEIVLINHQAEQMFGYLKDELLNKTVETLLPTSFQAIHAVHRTDYFKNPKARAMGDGQELKAVRKDGTQFPVEISLSPLETPDGPLVTAAIRDITSRKLIESKLKESEKLYRLISTNSRDLISLYKAGQDPIRIYVSPSCKEIMGYDQNEMINRSPYDFIVPEDAEEMKKTIHPETLGGKVAMKEYRARKKDGSIIWLETISNPFLDEEGKVFGFQTSARDITQHKQYEKELMLAKEQAENISIRLRALLQEKSDLIGLFSHDMRAPINQISGLTSLISISLDDPDTIKECVNKIGETINVQLTLYNNILAMLNSDQMVIDNKKEPVLLQEIVNKIQRNFEIAFKAKGVTVVTDISKAIIVNVQKDLFIQALENLISNAIKFSPPGKQVTITSEQDSESTTIIIRDQGVGFSQDKAERLFDRFTKEGKPGTNNEPSTGIGLYLAKKIVENHFGTIEAKSNGKETGATFIIRLPATEKN